MSSGPLITPMSVATTSIDGLMLITMKQVEDERGAVREFYRESSWLEQGLPSLGPWLQVNITESKPGAVRGLHGEAMTKVVAIAHGEAFGAYVDTRDGSPTKGEVVTVKLVPGVQVLLPNGVCNGFQSLGSTPTQYLYAFDSEWVPGMAGTARSPLDPDLGIPWPLPIDPEDRNQISEKDAKVG